MLFGGKFELELFLLFLVLVVNALGYPSPTPRAFLPVLFTVWSDDHELQQ